MSEVIALTLGSPKLVLTKPGDYTILLAEPGTNAEISAVFEVKGHDRVKLNVVIYHQAPHTRANTTFKGVVHDQGFLRLAGRIIIDEECGDTNSFLTERILLLSDDAKAEAVPDLEIKTDDVKCSHAASISRIPEEQIFYLMSRSLTRAAAIKLLIAGFLGLE